MPNKPTRFIATFAVASAALVSTAYAGNETFKQICSECHTGGFKGFVSGAPDIQNQSAWTYFLRRDTPAQMKDIVLYGSKKHKRKGGCKTCSDNEISTAVDYMLKLVK